MRAGELLHLTRVNTQTNLLVKNHRQDNCLKSSKTCQCTSNLSSDSRGSANMRWEEGYIEFRCWLRLLKITEQHHTQIINRTRLLDVSLKDSKDARSSLRNLASRELYLGQRFERDKRACKDSIIYAKGVDWNKSYVPAWQVMKLISVFNAMGSEVLVLQTWTS